MFFAALVISALVEVNERMRCTISQVGCYLKKTLMQGSVNCVAGSGNDGGPIHHRPSRMAAY